ncbi:OmpA family protein [Promicromonospora sp. NPDC023987]|uniref:OmpA family protein n=1 Tax=Promicromonospora sp. NPDC023987 TaxID=3155360 RepID=UPI0033DED5E7
MTLASGALMVALAVGGLAVGAESSPSAEPSPDPALMAEIAEEQQADLERLESVTVTDTMRADATFDLRPDGSRWDLVPADATWDLRPDDSTTPLETVVEKDESTTVRLTSDLLFQFGEHEVTKAADAAIRDLLDDVPRDAKVAVDGHTDSIGDDASNDELSQRRADAVAGILRDARPDLRLTVEGHGEQQPIAENEVDGKDNPAGRAKNRRVEVSYTGTVG